MFIAVIVLLLLSFFLRHYITHDNFTIVKSFIPAPTGDFKCKNSKYYNDKVVHKNSCSHYDNSPKLCDSNNCNSIRPSKWKIPCYHGVYQYSNK